MYHGAHVVREKVYEVVSLPPHLHELWGSESGHQDYMVKNWVTDTP